MTDYAFMQTGGVKASASFTPMVVSYTAGNIIDVAKEFIFTDKSGLLVQPGNLIRILSVIMKIDAAALISGEAIYTMHGYTVTPPSARANNAQWLRASGDLASYRGDITVGTPVAAGGTCYLKNELSDQQDVLAAGSSLFFELTNSGTFTGAAIARQISLYGIVI